LRRHERDKHPNGQILEISHKVTLRIYISVGLDQIAVQNATVLLHPELYGAVEF
jgi:hypothetical protein